MGAPKAGSVWGFVNLGTGQWVVPREVEGLRDLGC